MGGVSEKGMQLIWMRLSSENTIDKIRRRECTPGENIDPEVLIYYVKTLVDAAATVKIAGNPTVRLLYAFVLLIL
jgi:hypothetical protein